MKNLKRQKGFILINDPPVQIVGIGFPRLNIHHIGGRTESTQWTDPVWQSRLAVCNQLQVNFSLPDLSHIADDVLAIKTVNPAVRIANYSNWNGFLVGNPTQDIRNNYVKDNFTTDAIGGGVATDGMARTPDGLTIISNWPNKEDLNPTDFSNTYLGQLPVEYNTLEVYNQFYSGALATTFDDIYWDIWRYFGSWADRQADYNRDGVKYKDEFAGTGAADYENFDPTATNNAAIIRGKQAISAVVQSESISNRGTTIELLGNIGSWPDWFDGGQAHNDVILSAPTAMTDITQGGMIENFGHILGFNADGTIRPGSFERAYKDVQRLVSWISTSAVTNTKRVWVHAEFDSTEYKLASYALGVATMAGAYYGWAMQSDHKDPGELDEYFGQTASLLPVAQKVAALNWMGQPVGNHPAYGETYIEGLRGGIIESGVYALKFDDALLLLNPVSNGNQTITMPSGSWKHIAGDQRADNDGSIVGATVFITDGTALFLRNAELYPLLGTNRQGTPGWGGDNAAAEADRLVIGQMDASMLGPFMGSGLDNGSGGFLERSAAAKVVLGAHPDSTHSIWFYINNMEKGDGPSASTTYVEAQDGPGSSDGFLYDGNGDRKANNFGGFFLNLSDHVAVDGNGDRYPEWYSDNVVTPGLINPHIAGGVKIGGLNGINLYYDNYANFFTKSIVDPDFDGSDNNMQSYYDPEIAAHVYADAAVASITRSGRVATITTAAPHPLVNGSHIRVSGANQTEYNGDFSDTADDVVVLNDTTITYTVALTIASPATGTILLTGLDNHNEPRLIATAAMSAHRRNMTLGMQRDRDNHLGIWVGGNTNQWVQGDSGPVGGLRDVILEYRKNGDTSKSTIQCGFSENNSRAESVGSSRSGVDPTGVKRTSGGGSWQEAYNNGYHGVDVLDEPGILFYRWRVSCLQTGSGSGSQRIWPNIPASNASWAMFRWSFATSCMTNAYYCCSGIQVGTDNSGNGRSTPLFDEFGLINQGTTKLFRKWMGVAIDGPQTAVKADGTWQREFTNCLVILNPDRDNNVTVDASALPGGGNEWMFFNGAQDSSNNDGSDVAGFDFTISAIDAFFLVRKSWYDAL